MKVFRCLYRRCPPLPIPNREVKPARADGIAVTGVRVGRRRISQAPQLMLGGFFFAPPAPVAAGGHPGGTQSQGNTRNKSNPVLLLLTT